MENVFVKRPQRKPIIDGNNAQTKSLIIEYLKNRNQHNTFFSQARVLLTATKLDAGFAQQKLTKILNQLQPVNFQSRCLIDEIKSYNGEEENGTLNTHYIFLFLRLFDLIELFQQFQTVYNFDNGLSEQRLTKININLLAQHIEQIKKLNPYEHLNNDIDICYNYLNLVRTETSDNKRMELEAKITELYFKYAAPKRMRRAKQVPAELTV